ncbi:MAG: hypothetical protein EXR50_06125 [Dehalococcoidia bacterium]|nr:hypothetical protein [Dehalococcoidia bacterium]
MTAEELRPEASKEPASQPIADEVKGEAPSADAAQAPAARPRAAGRAPAGPPPGQQAPPTADAVKLEAIFKEILGEQAMKVEYNFGELVLTVLPEQILEVCRIGRTDPRLDFNYLRSLSGVDYVTHFEVVYHLYSLDKLHKITLKTRISHEEPEVDSVISVWSGADWHERELAEMFDINVKGHPNLVPLLLDEGVDEHPLLKSHPLVPMGEDRPGVITDLGESDWMGYRASGGKE